MKNFLKTNGPLLIAVLIVTIVAGIVVELIVKRVPVDGNGDEVAGAATAGKLSLKGIKNVVK